MNMYDLINYSCDGDAEGPHVVFDNGKPHT